MAFVTDPIGIIGEEEAAKMLREKKLSILERNWRIGKLEMDIIAENKKEIVFVEVKARTSTYGDIQPEEYVDEGKKRRIITAANAYVKYHRVEKKIRFDIIGILVNPRTMEVEEKHHFENAFEPQVHTVSSGSHGGKLLWHGRKPTRPNRNR